MTTCLGLTTHGIIPGLLLAMLCVTMAAADIAGDRNADPNDRPDEIRRGMPLKPDGKSRTQVFFERIAQSVQPDLKGTPDRLPTYLAQFRLEALNDPRLIAFDARARWDADRQVVILEGFVEYVEQRHALADYLNVLGFDRIDDRIELMPSSALGDQPFGIVSAVSTFLYQSPDERSESLTQSRQGDVVFLLRPEEAGFYYCHAWDGYVGYVRAGDVERVGLERLAGAIPEPDVSRIDPAIEAGAGLSGTPYQWGGTTAEGIDCSGLTRHVYAHIGVLLARDTDQQALAGRLTATRACRQTMRRGDLMFFLNARGRINHTAIYLGGQKFLESGGPGVRIASLDPENPDYVEQRDKSFAFAKRVLE